MTRAIPIIPTILVLAAAGVMIWLGIWQLGRADEKAALIARYDAASADMSEVAFPEDNDEEFWFRRAALTCVEVLSVAPVSGTAANGAKGWAIRAECRTYETDTPVTVDFGFTQTLGEEDWQDAAGPATGIIAPGPRLVLDPPAEGLAPLAKPDPNDLPNNHLSYAVQWFLFALTALLIYGFALRSRMRRQRD